jgi:hypothetical protein
VQTDPIDVSFDISEQDVLRVRAEMAGLTRDDLEKVPVEVSLQTETGYPHVGTFDYAAPTVGRAALRGLAWGVAAAYCGCG